MSHRAMEIHTVSQVGCKLYTTLTRLQRSRKTQMLVADCIHDTAEQEAVLGLFLNLLSLVFKNYFSDSYL